MKGYRSGTDNPINTLSEEVYAAYPDAKYVLTTRPDGRDGWWKSINEAAGWYSRRDFGRYMFRFLIWPVGFLRLTDDKVQCYIKRWTMKYGAYNRDNYDKHNADVKKLIPEKQLLVYDVREEWEPLCRFLEVDVLDEPFPKLNETGAMQAIHYGMMAYGAFTWLTYAGGVVAVGWLALHPETAKDLMRRSVASMAQLSRRVGMKS